MSTDAAKLAPSGTMTLIGLCAAIYLLDGLIHSILGPLAPEMSKSLQLTPAQLGPIFSANLLGQCLGLVIFPLFVHRIGERRLVLLAVIGFGLAQCATALADSALSLILWRLLTGVFLGGCLPSCLALVTSTAPPQRRGFAIMVLFTGYGLGATISGIVATSFIDLGGWRAAMVAVGAACLLTAAITWLYWRGEDSRLADSADPDLAADKQSALQILSPRYRAGTLMLWLLFISMLTVSYCLNSWLPTLLVKTGREPEFAALSVSVFSLGGIVSALGIGLLIDRIGAMRTLLSFLAIAIALFVLIGQVIVSASNAWLMVLLAACGFCVLGVYGGVNVVLANFYPQHLRAVGIGWAKSIGRIGTVIAPVLIGWALSVGIPEPSIMSLFALPTLLAVVSLVSMHRIERGYFLKPR